MRTRLGRKKRVTLEEVNPPCGWTKGRVIRNKVGEQAWAQPCRVL